MTPAYQNSIRLRRMSPDYTVFIVANHIKYDRHPEEWDACIADPERNAIAQTWLNQENTFDLWRHSRMHAFVEPLIKENCEASWLTVGDGRFGTDAHALISMGASNVHCSDISDTLLKIGHKHGFIREFSSQNAEALSFEDNSFDYVFCKEAYHHFPRPYIALYEMFRVAKKGVILIEPRDSLIDTDIFSWCIKMMIKCLGKHHQPHGFEEVGNYIYLLSERELEKFLLGMHYQFVAYHGLNDVYERGVEFIKLNTKDECDIKRIRRLKRRISLQNAVQFLRLRKSSILVAALFKESPSDQLKEALRVKRWKLKQLPRNPYLTSRHTQPNRIV